ncbi:MAG: hypothetical protein LBP19_03480 [Treponema sp.]|jgi:hypothetical protein|nr:hypothetical protein [Treponema sp.]
MSHKQDYIPNRDAGFDGWFKNINAYVTAKTGAGEWTHSPPMLRRHNAYSLGVIDPV